MQSDTFNKVKAAIENKQIIHGTYRGKVRVMCPHSVGYGKSGEEKALFYQFAGDSSRGGLPNWRCMTLYEFHITKIVPGDWHTGTSHTKRQPCVKQVVAEWRGDQA